MGGVQSSVFATANKHRKQCIRVHHKTKGKNRKIKMSADESIQHPPLAETLKSSPPTYIPPHLPYTTNSMGKITHRWAK